MSTQEFAKNSSENITMDETKAMNSENTKSSRTISFDYLRVCANIAVIMLHVAALCWYVTDVNGSDWKVFNVYDSLVRWSVPVFVMISGALFLGRDDVTVKKIFSKYVSRMAVAYFAWSFIYFITSGNSVMGQLAGLFSPDWHIYVIQLIKGHYHLWFVPMIAGLYICLPLFKQLVKDEKITKYYLWCGFFVMLIKQFMVICEDFGGGEKTAVIGSLYCVFNSMALEIFGGYAFYFVLGYVLSKKDIEKKLRVPIYCLGALGIFLTAFVTDIISTRKQYPIGNYYTEGLNVLLTAVAVFVLFKNMRFGNERVNRFVSKLSKWSFGSYCVHLLIVETFEKAGIHPMAFMSPVISTPILVITFFVISILISALLNCIPIVKKYIV